MDFRDLLEPKITRPIKLNRFWCEHCSAWILGLVPGVWDSRPMHIHAEDQPADKYPEAKP